MNQGLISEIRRSLEGRSTEDLLEMLRRGDGHAWSPEAFAAARAVLVDRGVTELPPLPVVDERGGPKEGTIKLIVSAFLIAVAILVGYHWLSVTMVEEPNREFNQLIFEWGIKNDQYKKGMTRADLEALLGKPAWVVSKAGRDEGTDVPALAPGQEDLWWRGAASGEVAMGARLGPDGKAIYFMREKDVRR